MRETTCQCGFSSQRDSNTELCCFCCQSEQTVEQTLVWPVFRDAMAVIWRRRNVLNWIVSMVVTGGPTVLSLSLHGIILPHSFLHFSWLHRRIVCNDCNAAYSRLMLFLWSVIECYQYSLWHNINPYLYPIPVSLNGMFVFWIYIVITDDKSALVQQMAWYRQATNHPANMT